MPEARAATLVGNLGETENGEDVAVGEKDYYSAFFSKREYATSFTTGANAGGYKLNGVTAKFAAKTGSPGGIEARIYSNSGTIPGMSLVQLSGNAPDTAGSHTYTCSGSGCALAASTTYWLAFKAPNAPLNVDNHYNWKNTTSDGETRTPANNGWSIGNDDKYREPGATAWGSYDGVGSGLFSVDASAVSFGAGSVTQTAATLTLSNWAGGDWHYKKTAPAPAGSCSSAQTGTTAGLTNLSPGTTYTFKAYSDSACSSGKEIRSVSFGTAAPTAPLAPTNLTAAGGDGSVALSWTSGGNGGSAITGWRYAQKEGTGGFGTWIDIPNSGPSTTSHTVAGLTGGIVYRFKVRAVNAMGAGAPSAESAPVSTDPTAPPAPADFTAVAGDASAALAARVASDGGSAIVRWEYVKKEGTGGFETDWTQVPDSASTSLSHTVAGLTNGTAYRFKVRAVNALGNGAESAESESVTPFKVTHRQRLAAVSAALAPEAARAMAGSAAAAVSGRIGRLASGQAAALSAGSLAGLLERHGRALSEGTLPPREALAGTSLALPLAAGGGGAGFGAGAGVWASADYDSLSGGGPALGWDGSVTALHLGADAPLGPEVRGGLALSFSEASFDYTDRSGDDPVAGEYSARMTGLHPYAARSWDDGSSLWAVLGYARGEVEVDDEAAGRQTSDGEMASLAAGGAVRLSPASRDGPSLDLKGEALTARFEVDDNGDLMTAVDADVHRLRAALAGGMRMAAGPGATVTPSAELGLRWDGGDGETGLGLELGGGVSYAAPAAGLRLEASARTLLAHEGALEEWGAGALARLEPDGRGRGLSLSLRPSLGAAGSGLPRLWEEGAAASGGGPAGARPAARLEAEGGYGLPAPGAPGALLTPYAGLGLEDGGSRRYGVGLRLERGPAASLGLEAARAEPAGGRPGHDAMLTLRLRW